MKTNNPQFKAGYTARMSDLSKEANPFAFDATPRRMWAIGWDYADAKKDEAAANAEPLERVPAKPFEQGQNAAKMGIDWRDCPYGSGDPYGTAEEQATNAAWVSWRAGHRAARWAKHGIERVDFGLGSDAIALDFDANAVEQVGVSKNFQSMMDLLGARTSISQAFKLAKPVSDSISSTLPYGFVTEEHHYKRVAELIEANNANVERRRVAERKLAVIAEAVAGLDRDPNEP